MRHNYNHDAEQIAPLQEHWKWQETTDRPACKPQRSHSQAKTFQTWYSSAAANSKIPTQHGATDKKVAFSTFGQRSRAPVVQTGIPFSVYSFTRLAGRCRGFPGAHV